MVDYTHGALSRPLARDFYARIQHAPWVLLALLARPAPVGDGGVGSTNGTTDPAVSCCGWVEPLISREEDEQHADESPTGAGGRSFKGAVGAILHTKSNVRVPVKQRFRGLARGGFRPPSVSVFRPEMVRCVANVSNLV